MNKTARVILAAGLALAVATPALAEFKLNGYFRTLGYMEEKKVSGVKGDEKGASEQFIDQRLRMKADWSINDNVRLVYFAEVDTTWGENNKAALGAGGQSYNNSGGSDGVNVETKQAYLDLKAGDTSAMIGIIGAADAFQSIVFNDDMAGAVVKHKINNTTLTLGYSKWDEDDQDTGTANAGVRGYDDDMDFYIADVTQKFSDTFTAGAAVYYLDDKRDDLEGTEVFFYGLRADAKFGDFGLDGFVVVQDGENNTSKVDVKGLAASAKGTMKLENGNIGLRVIYFNEDDDADDQMRWQGLKGEYAFVAENQMQFLTDPYVMNDGKERYAEVDAVQAGYGLLAFVLSGNHKLPDNMYLGWGAGYYMAMDEERDDDGFDTREGDTLGYELCARFGKKFFEKVDVSFNASWADYGDFYDDTVSVDRNPEDPDSTYKTYLMVNVPF